MVQMESSALWLIAFTLLANLSTFLTVTVINETTQGNGTYLYVTTRNPIRQQHEREILGVAQQKREVLAYNGTTTSISTTSPVTLWKLRQGHSTPRGNGTEASTGTPSASAGIVKREVRTTQQSTQSGPVTATGHQVQKRQATVGTLANNATEAFTSASTVSAGIVKREVRTTQQSTQSGPVTPTGHQVQKREATVDTLADNATEAFTGAPTVSVDLVKREARTTQETTEGGSPTPTGHQVVRRQADTTVGTSSTFPASTSRLVKREVTRFTTSNYASIVTSNLVKRSVSTTASVALAGEDSNSTTSAPGL